MRELEGVNELHKPNTEYNPRVLRAIKFAHSVKTPKDFSDCLSGIKSLENLNDRMEWEMPEELRTNTQDVELKPKPLVVSEVRDGVEEERDDEER